MPVLLRTDRLTRSYPSPGGTAPLELFRDLTLEVPTGEMLAIVGESGTGKSSLLHLLAALDRPTSGTVHLGPTDVSALTGKAASRFRNQEIGYVWQFHYLLPEFTALENVALPLLARGTGKQAALAAAQRWLDRVGLGARGHHRSGELSGGEQQRVSIARALVTEPRLLLADEPTGDLDNRNAEAIFTLLRELHADGNLTTVLVTHNLDFAARCDRTLRLVDGTLMPVTDLRE